MENRVLHKEHQPAADDAGGQKLQAGELDAVDLCGEFLHAQDVDAVHGRAGERLQIAAVHRAEEPHDAAAGSGEFCRIDAQEIESDDPEDGADPCDEGDLFPDEQAEKRREKHVQRRDESDLARSRMIERVLLEVARDAEDAAEDQAVGQKLSVRSLLGFQRFGGDGARDDLIPHQDEGHERRGAHQAPDPVIGKRVDDLHADALRDEGRAPDERGDEEDDGAFQLCSCMHK